MKRIFASAVLIAASVLPVTAQETAEPAPAAVETSSPAESDSAAAAADSGTPAVKKAEAGTAEVPPAKRPLPPDSEKSAEAALKDESADTVKEYTETLMYGISPEIVSLLQKLIDNDDPRFSDKIYDLFQTTKSPEIKNKIIEYFTHFKDPCIEDYAVTVVNDPYDTKQDTVTLVCRYISEVKCREAIPALITLIESDNDTYFLGALEALGNTGGPSEALYLADYIDRDDLSTAQKQALARVLGKINAVETWDKLVEMAENKDENSFIRMYAAESIGEMKKEESVPILAGLFEESDPNLRQYVIKGLENYPGNTEAKAVIIQGIKDEHYKVRLESVNAVEKNGIKEAMPYLIYRARNDKETAVKNACYPVIAALDTAEGNTFLTELLTDKKVSDNVKSQAAEALMKDSNAGEKEVIDLAEETLKDDRRKQLRYALGKLFAKYGRASYAGVCGDYIASKDASTVSIGLDIWKKGRFSGMESAVKTVADDPKAGANQKRAEKLLGIKDEESGGAPEKPAAAASSSAAK